MKKRIVGIFLSAFLLTGLIVLIEGPSKNADEAVETASEALTVSRTFVVSEEVSQREETSEPKLQTPPRELDPLQTAVSMAANMTAQVKGEGEEQGKTFSEIISNATDNTTNEAANNISYDDATNAEESPDEDEYANLAIAQVNDYVNVRSEPNTGSKILGKMYNGSVAQILAIVGEEQDWLQVVSGNVEGYIKKEYFLCGEEAEAVIEQYVTYYAKVNADRLNVRKEPDVSAKRLGYLDNGERAKVVENAGEWVKVSYAGTKEGYVSADYVTIEEEFIYAKSIEEELAEKKAMEEKLRRQQKSEAEAPEKKEYVPPVTTYATNEELRNQIIDYAMQYLGNKYVHGGKSLETGTDCSGFTSLIYKEFGYSISRTPTGQLQDAGRSIDISEIQKGDIICYTSNPKKACTHVALYMGDGKIIHAANSKKGVVIYDYDYDTIVGVKNLID